MDIYIYIYTYIHTYIHSNTLCSHDILVIFQCYWTHPSHPFDYLAPVLLILFSALGMSYIVSNPALSAVGPHLTRCLNGVVSNHSDTEFGRCMYSHAGVDCRSIAPEFKIRNMFYAREGIKVWPMAMKDGRLQVHMTTTPTLPHFKAVFLHPIKNAVEMIFFHQQVGLGKSWQRA